MNAKTKEKITEELIDFLSLQLSIPKEKINLDRSLFHDFGVDGDDAYELINEYSKKFSVDISNFDILKYFGTEESASPIKMVMEVFTKSNASNTPKLTVGSLVNAVITGHLQ